MPAAAEANRRPTLSLRSSPTRLAQAVSRRSMPRKAMRCRAGIELASAIDRFPPRPILLDAANHFDLQLAQLLAKRVAIEPQQLRRADLVAARCRQGQLQQGPLDLAQHPVIEAGRRHAVAVAGEIAPQMPPDRLAQELAAAG